MSTDGQRTLWRRNIAENFNRLSSAHERHRRQTDRQTTDRRQTDRRWHIANMNLSSRSLKTIRKSCFRMHTDCIHHMSSGCWYFAQHSFLRVLSKIPTSVAEIGQQLVTVELLLLNTAVDPAWKAHVRAYTLNQSKNRRCIQPVALLGEAERPGWHHPGGDTRMELFVCGWLYKEHWRNDVERRRGQEWRRDDS